MKFYMFIHFTFSIPVSSEKARVKKEFKKELARPREVGEAIAVESPREFSTESDIKILIVDDEPINLQVFSNQLEQFNYEILLAKSGAEALAIIEKEQKPDLVILDIMMPKMSGYEVCRKIREKYSSGELPIIMVTAKNQVSDLVEGLASGANDYISKPVSRDELLARIRTHLKLSKISGAYARFVPDEFLQFLEKESIIDVKLGDNVQRLMTILFSDIRQFTKISEKMTPQENFEFINSYLNTSLYSYFAKLFFINSNIEFILSLILFFSLNSSSDEVSFCSSSLIVRFFSVSSFVFTTLVFGGSFTHASIVIASVKSKVESSSTRNQSSSPSS